MKHWSHFLLQGMYRLIPFFALVSLASTTPSFAATWQVATTGVDAPSCGTSTAPCRTIQYTINTIATSGDTLAIQPGTYSEQLTITKNLVLQGMAPLSQSPSVIDGAQQGTVISIPSGVSVVLYQLVIQNGAAIQPSTATAEVAGGIHNQGTLSLRTSVVQNNQATAASSNLAPAAGGILNDGSLNISDSIIANNYGMSGCFTAGGVFNSSGTLTVQSSLFSGNLASAGACSGPSILPNVDGIRINFGTNTIATTYLAGNSVVTNGPLTFSQSTTTGSITNYSNLTVINSTITGSGIFNNNIGTTVIGKADISNSTVSTINFGAPLYSTIRNSILSSCSGAFVSGDYNILPSGCTFVSGGHDLIGVSPNLGPLANNGGPTPTMAPLTGSPAINGGNPTGCADRSGTLIVVDQRNYPRLNPPLGNCDIGAVEVH